MPCVGMEGERWQASRLGVGLLNASTSLRFSAGGGDAESRDLPCSHPN